MHRLLTAIAALMPLLASAHTTPHNAPGCMNPVIPGYFADPTVKQFDSNYYIYATTDGSGAGFGPAQLWTSTDFVNWTLLPMNWPDSHWIWAPDVMQHPADSLFYYTYCQPCQIHVGVSETPRGPWHNILGESEAVLVPDRFVTNAITLDGQTFTDTDGQVYMYWGTWGIYKGFGCGAGRLNPDMKGFAETRLIPNTEVTDFFEAPFVLKRDSTYYFMYSSGSCHDETYRVQYATSQSPLGPYTYRGCILESTPDGTVHGPGHHSILCRDGQYYILYHRHDNPHSNRGFHRQLCLDRMQFAPDGSILPVTPTHSGIGYLGTPAVTTPNLATGCKVTASSAYGSDFRPEYAVDDNNGTLWRAADMGQQWIELDLGATKTIGTVMTQWEYGTQFYQYLIETSTDRRNWTTFSDKTANRLAGSPMTDFGRAKARYLRITFTGGEKCGFPAALWNVKVYSTDVTYAPQQWIGLDGSDFKGRVWANCCGQLAGQFTLTCGHAITRRIDGKTAVVIDPNSRLEFASGVLDPSLPHTFTAHLYAQGRWTSVCLDKYLKKGKITIDSGSDTLILANVRYYNRALHTAELSHDATTDIRTNPPAASSPVGLVVDIDVSTMAVGDTVGYFGNGRGLEGYFESVGQPAVVCEIGGHRALRMDSSTIYRSTFALPSTLRDNCPYTLEMTILNPTIELNECVADFTTSHDELEKIMAVNGTEPRCGVMQHYGWYEDAGYEGVASLAGQWQHVRVEFDGRMERVWINSRLVSEKDIQLLVKPSQYVTIGRNAEGEWPFTGYIASLRLYDCRN